MRPQLPSLTTLWRLVAFGAVVVVALVNLRALVERFPPAAPYADAAANDPAIRQEQRFAALRADLKARGLRGDVGYRGDVPPDRLFPDATACADYYLAQFTLAPFVLDPNFAAHNWCVTNFRTLPASARPLPGWRIVQDFGDGVLLLRKERP